VAVAVAVGLPFRHHTTDLLLAARLIAQSLAGGVVYLGLAQLMRIRELQPILSMPRRLTR
jgi:hypothetical protein